MAKILRMMSTTFSSEHLAPDGTRRFRKGLVVEVDDDTAKRWERNRIAEPWDGKVGDRIDDEDRDMTPDQIDAEIARLQGLRDRPRPAGRITRSDLGRGAPTEPVNRLAGVPADDDEVEQPIGRAPYAEPGAPHPLANFGLTELQRTNLERAGFTRADIIEEATDAELLEVPGIGESAVKKLRG